MAKHPNVEKSPFGNLEAKPDVAPTAQGFYCIAVREGINPTTQSLVNKGEKFYLADPSKFSDASKEFVREITDKDGKRTGVKKKMGVVGWMTRVDASAPVEAAPAPVEAAPAPVTDNSTGDVI